MGWFLGILALFVLVLNLALGGFAAYQHRQTLFERARADLAETLERKAVQKAAESDRQAAEARQASIQAGQEVQRLQAAFRAHLRPPAPAAAPADDPVLAKGLEEAGLKVGLVVFQGETPSTLERGDAVKVWDWSRQSLRIPALELRLADAEHLVEGQTIEASALKVEVLDLDRSRQDWIAAHGAALDRSLALQEEVKALHKEATTRAIQKWLLVGGAALTGYFAGRH